MSMVKKLLATARRAICHRLRSGYLRPVIYALVLIVSLFLFPAAPVRGRWEALRACACRPTSPAIETMPKR